MANQPNTSSSATGAPAAAGSLPAQEPSPNSMSRGVRETIEAIAIAFALAFLFKTFQAEAFVIPTGSMAPTLMGRHKDVICPECGYAYTASGSEEANRDGSEKNDPNWQVVACTCPICRFRMSVDPLNPENRGHNATPSYSGDRIWVSKVPYHFSEPRRWDVLVFRFPEEAETYYIKRLVGLPNETVRIHHGDIYVKGKDDKEFSLVRKPPEKIRAIAQIVHDNDYVSPKLIEREWPLRWQPWSTEDQAGDWQVSDDTRSYHSDGKADGEAWIRYQHIVPSDKVWRAWYEEASTSNGNPRPQLITDFYAFNTRELRGGPGSEASMLGLHWVGDLILECQVDLRGDQGEVLFDLVKAGEHYRCTVNVATGQARLGIVGRTDWQPTAATALRGPGQHQVRFANVDRQLLLWVDDRVVTFDMPTTYDAPAHDRPVVGADRGDLAPAGVGTRGAAVEVSHLKLLRDIYYIADTNSSHVLSDFRRSGSFLPWLHPGDRGAEDQLADFLATPEKWQTPRGNIFDLRQDAKFELGPDQFFVLGDNSPASSDARLWSSQHYVDRDLLVGKALLVYWPHPLELPIPMTERSFGIVPNLSKMGLIR